LSKPKKSTPKAKSGKQEESLEKQLKVGEPWIERSTGIRLLALLSILMAVYMTWQLEPSLGFWEALLWGLGFGGSLWAIFYGMQLFRKILR